MEKVLCTLIAGFTCLGNMFGQNAPPRSIFDEYEAGQRVINEIIAENNLSATIEGCAYAGCFSGDSWLIIKKGAVSYEVITGSKGTAITKTYNVDLTNKVLSSLFIWANRQEPIVYDIRDVNYIPVYYYYILFDEDHDKKMEFNIYTMNAYKKAQRTRKDCKMLPFTKEQMDLIWKFLDVVA